MTGGAQGLFDLNDLDEVTTAADLMRMDDLVCDALEKAGL